MPPVLENLEVNFTPHRRWQRY
jgi:hypothetical protein